jgi:hypothetical protein
MHICICVYDKYANIFLILVGGYMFECI